MSAVHWKNAANGSFNTASAWIPQGVPGAADTAVIDAVGTYTVSSTSNNEVTELDTINTATLAITAGVFQVDLVANNYGTVSVHDGATLKLLSTFPLNAGKIMLGAASASTELKVGIDTFFGGGGNVTLSDSAKNIIDGGMLTNHDNTIAGAGSLSVAFLNNDPGGTIDGSGATNPLIIHTNNTVTNAGVLRSTGAGGLDIKDTVNNVDGVDPPGLFKATGSGHVDLDGGIIEGGVLATSGNGRIRTKSGAVGMLEGDSTSHKIFNTGLFVVSDNSTLQLAATLENTGTIDLNSTANSSRLEILPSGIVGDVLAGHGKVTLTDNSHNLIYAPAAATLINSDNTISGAGTIGVNANLTFENFGVVDASGMANKLVLNTGATAITNGGTIQDSGAGGLEIDSIVQNDGGAVVAKASSGAGVLVKGTSIRRGLVETLTAGSLITLAAGKLENGDVTTAAGSTITTQSGTSDSYVGVLTLLQVVGAPQLDVVNAGKIAVADNSDLALGGLDTNTGTIAVNASSHSTTLRITDATLTGGGKLTMTDNANNFIHSIQATAGVTDASFSGSITGTIHTGDQITVSFSMPSPNITVTVNYTVTNPTSASVARGLAAAINSQLAAENIEAFASGNTFSIFQPGSAANSTALFSSTTGSESLPANGNLSGGAGFANVLTNIDNIISGAGTIGNADQTLQLINEKSGVINANGTHSLTINTGTQSVINAGTIESTAAGGLNIFSNVDNAGGNLKASAGTLEVSGAVDGGTATIGGNGVIQLDARQNAANVVFAAGSTGKLKLASGNAAQGLDPALVLSGTIFGFGANTSQRIDLVDINFASAREGYAGSNASGRLTVSDSSGDSVTLNSAGKYTSASFTLKDDGFGGTLITDPPPAANSFVHSAPLFGSYIASSFVAAPGAFGGPPITALAAADMPLLAHPAHSGTS
jgi:hypothetical protein